jgi:hypothetical protein
MKWFCLLVYLLFSFSGTLQAQDKASPAGSGSWKRGLYFGFGQSRLAIKESNWRQTTYRDSIISIRSTEGFALYMGIMVQYQLDDTWGIRGSLQLSFDDGKIVLEKQQGPETLKKEQVFLAVPIYLVGTQKVNKKHIVYGLAGPNLRYDLAANIESTRIVATKSFVPAADLGVGFGFNIKGSFMLCPEIIYSIGLGNARDNASNIFANVVSSVKTGGYHFKLLLQSL